MRTISLSWALLVLCCWIVPAVLTPRSAAAQQPAPAPAPAGAGTPALLTQVQAADVLSDLITYTVATILLVRDLH